MGYEYDMKYFIIIYTVIFNYSLIDNLRCEFGGMVSTSNAVDNEVIEITTDSPVVWTIEINI